MTSFPVRSKQFFISTAEYERPNTKLLVDGGINKIAVVDADVSQYKSNPQGLIQCNPNI